MPSAYGICNILAGVPQDQQFLVVNIVNACAKRAMGHGMFVEWLGAFIAGWNETGDPAKAAEGALYEWDL